MRAGQDPVSAAAPQWKKISASRLLFLVLRVTFHQITHLGIQQIKFWWRYWGTMFCWGAGETTDKSLFSNPSVSSTSEVWGNCFLHILLGNVCQPRYRSAFSQKHQLGNQWLTLQWGEGVIVVTHWSPVLGCLLVRVLSMGRGGLCPLAPLLVPPHSFQKWEHWASQNYPRIPSGLILIFQPCGRRAAHMKLGCCKVLKFLNEPPKFIVVGFL